MINASIKFSLKESRVLDTLLHSFLLISMLRLQRLSTSAHETYHFVLIDSLHRRHIFKHRSYRNGIVLKGSYHLYRLFTRKTQHFKVSTSAKNSSDIKRYPVSPAAGAAIRDLSHRWQLRLRRGGL